jgi:hypothetical protein
MMQREVVMISVLAVLVLFLIEYLAMRTGTENFSFLQEQQRCSSGCSSRKEHVVGDISNVAMAPPSVPEMSTHSSVPVTLSSPVPVMSTNSPVPVMSTNSPVPVMSTNSPVPVTFATPSITSDNQTMGSSDLLSTINELNNSVNELKNRVNNMSTSTTVTELNSKDAYNHSLKVRAGMDSYNNSLKERAGIDRSITREEQGNILSDMGYHDYHHLPIAENYTHRSDDFGYNFLPPSEWYPQPAFPPVCVTEQKCPVCPVYTIGAPVDVKEWSNSTRITQPDNINLKFVKERLNSGR